MVLSRFRFSLPPATPLTILSFLLALAASGQESQKIFGRITDGFDSLQGVKVTIQEGGDETYSDQEGRYELYAKPRDLLVFSRVGMDTIRIVVEDVTGRLNIEMNRVVEELDEVVVTEQKMSKQKRLSMDYYSKPTIINTSFGYLDSEASAYHIKMIQGSDLSQAAPDILSAIASRVAGVRIASYVDPVSRLTQKGLFLRGTSSINLNKPAIFEIDMVLYTDPPTWLDISNVQRVGIIPGLQAAWRYGNLASGGVIIINTLNMFHGLKEENSTAIYDQARLRDNYASDQYLTESDIQKNASSYLTALYESASVQGAIGVIKAFENAYFRDPYFFLEGYKYLYDVNAAKQADSLLQAHAEVFEANPVSLKALAYSYEEQGRLQKAHQIYKQVYALRPAYAQSFIDLANSFYALNEVDKSYGILMRYANLITESLIEVDTTELANLFENEIRALNAARSAEPNEEASTRLVFQWNDGEAEFDLQFINPEKQYYTWKHSLEANPDRIYREKIHGFTTQEYLLDYSLPGIWEVRCTYSGNKKVGPSYLKAYIYRNFGTPAQTREIRVFRLDLIGPARQLFTFEVPRGPRVLR